MHVFFEVSDDFNRGLCFVDLVVISYKDGLSLTCTVRLCFVVNAQVFSRNNSQRYHYMI